MQDVNVLAAGALGMFGPQGVVGHAEAAGGEQVSLVAIFGKRSWLAHQPVNDMAIVDAMLVLTPQPGHRQHQLLAVPHLYGLRR
jgi:hypothetical protein